MIDNLISITPSKKAYDVLRSLALNKVLPSQIIKYLDDHKEWLEIDNANQKQPFLTIQDIKALQNVLTEIESNVHLYEILEDATIEFFKSPEPPRNAELQARIEKLKKDQEEMEYYQMIRNVDLQQSKSLKTSFSAEVRSLRSQMVAVVNFLVSVGGTFAFGYKLIEYTLPTQSLPAQVLVGISMSVIVALAELYFLAKQLDTEN